MFYLLSQWIQTQQLEIEQLSSLSQAAIPTDETFFNVIERSLQNNDIASATNQITLNNANNMQIQFEQVGFDDFIHWLMVLEAQYPVQVTQITANRLESTPGMAQINMSINQRENGAVVELIY